MTQFGLGTNPTDWGRSRFWVSGLGKRPVKPKESKESMIQVSFWGEPGRSERYQTEGEESISLLLIDNELGL